MDVTNVRPSALAGLFSAGGEEAKSALATKLSESDVPAFLAAAEAILKGSGGPFYLGEEACSEKKIIGDIPDETRRSITLIAL